MLIGMRWDKKQAMPMNEIHFDLVETSIDGARSRLWKLEAAECSEMQTLHIARIGWHETRAPYRRVRLRPEGSFFLVCVEGEGRILLDGRWQRITAGAACLAPPRVLNAFHAVPGKRFVFAWVRYDESARAMPLVGAASPVRISSGGAELARAVAGLCAEWKSARAPQVLHHWLSLVHTFTTRLACPWESDDRLWKLWELAGRELAAPWTLRTLAERAHMSTEHLRRLCVKTLGRTPIHHLTYMRMQRAQQIIETTDDKLDAIAPQVGYPDTQVFSRAFKRCIGMSPKEYRTRR